MKSKITVDEVLKQIKSLYHGPDDTAGYPPPSPPVGTKAEIFNPSLFADVEERAAKAPDILMDSFPDLIKYLTEGLKTDIQKLRSLFIWLSKRELIDQTKYARDNLPKNSPLECLQRFVRSGDIATKRKELTAFFALLCRLSGIPCVVLRGYDKNSTLYDVGERLMDAAWCWNAVHVDGGWRLVHTINALAAIYGYVRGGLVLLEVDGKAVRQRNEEQEGCLQQHLKEDSFLPDPNIFIYYCFPVHEDSRWQLIPQPWTLKQFWDTPLFSRIYLRSEWHLSDDHRSVVEAPGGNCRICMDRVPPEENRITYCLYVNEGRSERRVGEALQQDRYVTVGADQCITIRLPVTGSYRLDISDAEKAFLCSVRIDYTGGEDTQGLVPWTAGSVPGLGADWTVAGDWPALRLETREGRKLGAELEAAADEGDLRILERVLRQCLSRGYRDKEVIAKAYTALYRLHRAATRKAMDSGSIAELETAVTNVDQSLLAAILHQTTWYRAALDDLRYKRRVASVRHQIQNLGLRQVSEVQSYSRPHDGVRAAVVATYLLLGERQERLQDWGYVRSLLRQRGRQGVLSRILQHDPRGTDLPQRRAALRLLASCSEEEIRSLSLGAAAFYRWCTAILEGCEPNNPADSSMLAPVEETPLEIDNVLNDDDHTSIASDNTNIDNKNNVNIDFTKSSTEH